jgi:hypothetical protein
MTVSWTANFFVETPQGMALLCLISALCSIALSQSCKRFFRNTFRPAIAHNFYEHILQKWLGPFLSKHKIIATFIRLQGLGETLVDCIACLIATFFLVAFLSASLTAALISIISNGFIYSAYLLFLLSFAAMLASLLLQNLQYFYRVANRLK